VTSLSFTKNQQEWGKFAAVGHAKVKKLSSPEAFPVDPVGGKGPDPITGSRFAVAYFPQNDPPF